jgi:hypothetical protein
MTDPVKKTDEQISPAAGAPEPKPEPKPEAKPKADAAPPEPAKEPKGEPQEPAGEVDEAQVEAALKEGKSLPAMPVKAFLSRVRRASRQQLMDLFGTDDKEAILQWKREYDTMRKAQDERDRAAMSEKERLEKDLQTAKDEAAAVKQEFDTYREERAYEQVDNGISRAAEKHIDSDAVDYVAQKFAKHLLSLDKDDADDRAKLKAYQKDPDAVAAWFKEYADSHPKFAKEAKAPKAKEEKPKPEEKKAPLNTAPKTKEEKPKEEKPGSNANGKTVRPGPNAMSTEEIRQRTGHSWR